MGQEGVSVGWGAIRMATNILASLDMGETLSTMH